MSHVSTVKTTIKDLTMLKRTLKELGVAYAEGKEISGQYVRGVKVDLHFTGTDVGVIKDSDGNYSFKGDFYGMHGGEKKFTNSIVQKYTVLKLRDGLNKLGFQGISETVDKDGTVNLSAVAA